MDFLDFFSAKKKRKKKKTGNPCPPNKSNPGDGEDASDTFLKSKGWAKDKKTGKWKEPK